MLIVSTRSIHNANGLILRAWRRFSLPEKDKLRGQRGVRDVANVLSCFGEVMVAKELSVLDCYMKTDVAVRRHDGGWVCFQVRSSDEGAYKFWQESQSRRHFLSGDTARRVCGRDYVEFSRADILVAPRDPKEQVKLFFYLWGLLWEPQVSDLPELEVYSTVVRLAA